MKWHFITWDDFASAISICIIGLAFIGWVLWVIPGIEFTIREPNVNIAIGEAIIYLVGLAIIANQQLIRMGAKISFRQEYGRD